MRVTEGPFEWPLPDDEVQAALEAAFRDGSWGKYRGPNCEKLVGDLQAKFASEYALPCSSGTIGVELALRGCGVEAGDEVVLAGYDFAGNFRAIEAIGARPVLVDVGLQSWSLDAGALADVQRDKVKAVVVSHLHGGLADMRAIGAIAQERGWMVVEDACQQPGARLAGKPVGSWGDVGVLSFGGSKLLTSGRGGAVLTSNAQIQQRMKVYAERGNLAFPLSELQAAVLLPQLEKLEGRNRRRAENVEVVLQATGDLEGRLRSLRQTEGAEPAYYKLPWSVVGAESDSQVRDRLLAKLQTAGVPVDFGFRGFTLRSERRCEKVGSLENSSRLSQSTILLHHPVLLKEKNTAQQVGQVLNHEVLQFVL